MNKKYKEYVETLRKKADIDYAAAVLSWDKETYMPPKGAHFRSQQVATLSGISHEIFTDKKFGELLKSLNSNSNGLLEKEKRNVELSLKDYIRIEKLDTNFVIERSKVISTAYHAWLEARKANDFSIYTKALKKLVEIKREEASLIGYDQHPYDGLLDEFEPGMTVNKLDILFKDVKEQLVEFVNKIKSQPQVQNSFLKKFYPKDKQWTYGLQLLKNMGYDFEQGRQDVSPHPFTINFSPNDVRVTTRIDENDLANMVWSCIHEGGHALYEQGLSVEEYGLPLGSYLTVGVHESQSRLWENHIGRSLDYWKFNYPTLQDLFPDNLSPVSLEAFYKGINRVEPNLIRTESDELHYHFHIMIRYEIEKELIEGSIEVENLNQIWNDKYMDYLGVKVPDDNKGVLQDVHWAHGVFGYFPTYSIGSFYAAQLYQSVEREIPNLPKLIASGDNSQLLHWVRERIHQHGKQYNAEDLIEKITGESFNFKYFLDYCKRKYISIYEL
ncbi:MAG: carboxypeptidase M32 [Bacteroidetes bacterium]|nr:carboxypeptidase M32 [Bacteroidota bacterium]